MKSGVPSSQVQSTLASTTLSEVLGHRTIIDRGTDEHELLCAQRALSLL